MVFPRHTASLPQSVASMLQGRRPSVGQTERTHSHVCAKTRRGQICLQKRKRSSMRRDSVHVPCQDSTGYLMCTSHSWRYIMKFWHLMSHGGTFIRAMSTQKPKVAEKRCHRKHLLCWPAFLKAFSLRWLACFIILSRTPRLPNKLAGSIPHNEYPPNEEVFEFSSGRCYRRSHWNLKSEMVQRTRRRALSQHVCRSKRRSW